MMLPAAGADSHYHPDPVILAFDSAAGLSDQDSVSAFASDFRQSYAPQLSFNIPYFNLTHTVWPL